MMNRQPHPLFAFAGEAEAPCRLSFEFFPPSTPTLEARLWQTVERLAPLRPDFVSVTYGAGGSTRERTHRLVQEITRKKALATAAHLTCVAASRAEVDAIVDAYVAADIRHIVALRGDPAEGDSTYRPHPDGYQNAADLVAGIRRRYGPDQLKLTVAAHPEGHPESSDRSADIDHFVRKIEAGANQAITQFFFNIDDYFRLRDDCAARGVTVPIIPGILPVTNYATLTRFARINGAALPDWLGRLFEGLDDHPTTRTLVAASVAVRQVEALYEGGVRDFHFYTLNRADLSYAICHMLGRRPVEDSQ